MWFGDYYGLDDALSYYYEVGRLWAMLHGDAKRNQATPCRIEETVTGARRNVEPIRALAGGRHQISRTQRAVR
jgi:hypothetical protein